MIMCNETAKPRVLSTNYTSPPVALPPPPPSPVNAEEAIHFAHARSGKVLFPAYNFHLSYSGKFNSQINICLTSMQAPLISNRVV